MSHPLCLCRLLLHAPIHYWLLHSGVSVRRQHRVYPEQWGGIGAAYLVLGDIPENGFNILWWLCTRSYCVVCWGKPRSMQVNEISWVWLKFWTIKYILLMTPITLTTAINEYTWGSYHIEKKTARSLPSCCHFCWLSRGGGSVRFISHSEASCHRGTWSPPSYVFVSWT